MHLFHFWPPAPMHPPPHPQAAQESKHMVILAQGGGATELNGAMRFCSAEPSNTHKSLLLERALVRASLPVILNKEGRCSFT